MPSKLSTLPVDKFLEKLGASDAVPGGGAAAALVAAQASALGEMVARLNLKRAEKQNIKNSPSAKNIAPLVKIKKSLANLIEKDAQIFLALSKFKKEDRSTSAYQAALKKAALTPYEICRGCELGLKIIVGEKSRTSAWLYSDLLESSILFEAGFRAARLNVEINLASILDKNFVAKTTLDLDRLATQIQSVRLA